MSLYRQGKVNSRVFADCVIKLKKAFPKLSPGWYDVLNDYLDEEGFSNERFIDSVNNLIKTCPYPEPTIANILGYDRTIKLYTHDELADKAIKQGPKFWELFTLVDHNGFPMYARNEDFQAFHLKAWKSKEKTESAKVYEINNDPEKWKGMFSDLLEKSE